MTDPEYAVRRFRLGVGYALDLGLTGRPAPGTHLAERPLPVLSPDQHDRLLRSLSCPHEATEEDV